MTIKDLAAITGYSVGTVSRALNDHPNVSGKARKTILQAAKECGFQINVNAKQLKQTSSNTILVIVKGTGNEFFTEMLEYLQPLISRTRYQLVVDYLDEEDNEVIRAVQLCREKKPQGILFLGGNEKNFTADFDKIDIPCVEVTNDASSLAYHNLSSVTTDDRAAARCAIDTLVAAGHRNIAVMAVTGIPPISAACGMRAACSPSRKTESCLILKVTIRAFVSPVRTAIRRQRSF